MENSKYILNKISYIPKPISSLATYNIFNVLQLESDEVRLHSRLLGDFLSINGQHGVRAHFLEMFLSAFQCEDVFPDVAKVHTHVEKYIGPVTETTGGQIDLLLLDDQNNCLIIENKIYAGDQKNQLLRYLNFAKQQESRGGKSKIIYLTLFGTLASQESIGKMNNHEFYQCLSYQNDINSWLNSCLTKRVLDPNVVNTINQYQNLINKLTDMTSNEEQSPIIDEISSSLENFQAAKQIHGAFLAAKCNILRTGISKIVKSLESDYPKLKFIISPQFGYKFHGLEIHHTMDKVNWNSHIRFSFLSDARDCYIEIHPGFNQDKLNDKNHDHRLKYEEILNPNFPNNIGRIMKTEQNWQGEWLMYYLFFENRFEDILKDDESFISQVKHDLKILIDTFLSVVKIEV